MKYLISFIFIPFHIIAYTVGIISDSNGHDWPDRKSFSTYFEELSGFKVINDSQDCSCSIQGANRLIKMISDYHPDIIFIELGINDLSWQIPPLARKYILKCYSEISKTYKTPVIISKIDYLTYYNTNIFATNRRWGKEDCDFYLYLTNMEYTTSYGENIGLILFPFLTKDIIENYTIKNENDHIHLTDKGALLVAHRLYNTIKDQ